MANNRFETDAVAWSVLFMYCIRFIVACACVLCSINMNVAFRYTMQMQVGNKAGSTTSSHSLRGPHHGGRGSIERPNSRVQEHTPILASPSGPQHRHTTKSHFPTNVPNVETHQVLRDPPIHHQPPPPYSIDPPKSDSKAHPDSIMQLYEEIMLSDSETIKVQQETLETQQDVVRSQAQAIKQLREILESQDAQIVQLEHTIADLRERAQ